MREVALGDLVEIKGGGTPDRSNNSFWGGNIPWASVKDFKGTEIGHTCEKITSLGLMNSASNLIPAGTIIIPTRMAVGKAAINVIDLAINQDLKALFPSSRVDTRYLLHALLSSSTVLERRASGATVKGITLDILRALPIPLPPLSEQRRIAAILDQTDALRAKRRAALAQLDELARAIFEHMFVQPDGVAAQSPLVPISAIATSMRTGPFGSDLLHSEFVDQGVAVLGIDNAVSNQFAWDQLRFITYSKYKELIKYQVFPGDVLITIMGTCGRAAIVPDDIPLAITTKHLCAITLDREKCLSEYLHACFLRHPFVLQQLGATARGAVMPGLNIGLIKSTQLPLPALHHQRRFADLMSNVESLRQGFVESLKLFDSFFASLQHRAFRGEL